MSELKHGLMENDKIKILWHEDYYDGPLNGFLKYENNKYFFEVVDELQYYDEAFKDDDINIFIRARVYYAYEITKKEYSYYKKWNDYFQDCKEKSQAALAEYYQKRQDLYESYEPDKEKIVGYFVDIPRTKDVHAYKII